MGLQKIGFAALNAIGQLEHPGQRTARNQERRNAHRRAGETEGAHSPGRFHFEPAQPFIGRHKPQLGFVQDEGDAGSLCRKKTG